VIDEEGGIKRIGLVLHGGWLVAGLGMGRGAFGGSGNGHRRNAFGFDEWGGAAVPIGRGTLLQKGRNRVVRFRRCGECGRGMRKGCGPGAQQFKEDQTNKKQPGIVPGTAKQASRGGVYEKVWCDDGSMRVLQSFRAKRRSQQEVSVCSKQARGEQKGTRKDQDVLSQQAQKETGLVRILSSNANKIRSRIVSCTGEGRETRMKQVMPVYPESITKIMSKERVTGSTLQGTNTTRTSNPRELYPKKCLCVKGISDQTERIGQRRRKLSMPFLFL
jgi:hypothetical protein